MNMYNFSPAYQSNQLVTAAAGSATASLDAAAKAFRVVNKSANMVYVRTFPNAAGAVAATTADLGIPPHDVFYGTKDQTHDKISYIAPAGNSDIEIMTGEGF